MSDFHTISSGAKIETYGFHSEGIIAATRALQAAFTNPTVSTNPTKSSNSKGGRFY